MFLGLLNATDIAGIIKAGADTRMTDKQFLEREIVKFQISPARNDMIKAERYYKGEHDILHRKRMAIGENGELKEVTNLPNNKIVDNQYGKMVDQKKNYLLGKPITFESENKAYSGLLKDIFNKMFLRTIKNLGCDVINGGIAWLYPYYDEKGNFCFKRFPGYEVLPFWRDAEHTVLDGAVRIYDVDTYEGTTEKIITKVEVYDDNGVYYFDLENGRLIPDMQYPFMNYLTLESTDNKGETIQQAWNWDKIPLIAFKANDKEIPLIKRVKSLQDGINIMLSDFENNMQEDARNTILILENYDGTNLGEFRRNLALYGAVKVRSGDGAKGDVRTLEVTVNSENYKAIVELFKKALIENARGYDAKDDRMSGNPNQMNIQSMYSDIDLDANEMETEFQASFEELLWFVNIHFANSGKGSFENEDVNIIFNRDILINESEAIENCSKSKGVISDETIVGQHPWTDDPQEELKKLEEQNRSGMIDDYKKTFKNAKITDPGGGADEE